MTEFTPLNTNHGNMFDLAGFKAEEEDNESLDQIIKEEDAGDQSAKAEEAAEVSNNIMLEAYEGLRTFLLTSLTGHRACGQDPYFDTSQAWPEEGRRGCR